MWLTDMGDGSKNCVEETSARLRDQSLREEDLWKLFEQLPYSEHTETGSAALNSFIHSALPQGHGITVWGWIWPMHTPVQDEHVFRTLISVDEVEGITSFF